MGQASNKFLFYGLKITSHLLMKVSISRISLVMSGRASLADSVGPISVGANTVAKLCEFILFIAQCRDTLCRCSIMYLRVSW
jgi:hypothetical protein